MTDGSEFALNCPLPLNPTDFVTMAHGGGGSVMQRLIEEVFCAAFDNPLPGVQHDAATFAVDGKRLAFTTDSYVVQPLFFPGGDIGSLAVHGTVNDLAMGGARPLYLSAGFILEEGLPMETLKRVVDSMAEAARCAGVAIVTGDTKVINRGSGDGLYINTAGVGVVEEGCCVSPAAIREGDCVLVNGDLARHGIAIMATREGLAFETTIESDSAPVSGEVRALFDAGIEVHCLRDLTRGGLSSTANELVKASGLTLRLEETAIPVREDVRGACELLGFDPLYVANEGRFAAFVAGADAERAVEVLREAGAQRPTVVGKVTAAQPPRVILRSQIGTERIIDMLSGEQLPRIC